MVIAPDSFKGSLDATSLSAELATGWATVRPRDQLVLLPQADGGEGTLTAIASCHPEAVWHEIADVCGPDGRMVPGRWLSLDDGTAVVELAQMSGLPLMRALDPAHATAAGLGQVINAALDAGATALVVGLGGSASTDGGAGALVSMGARLLDSHGDELGIGGAALAQLHTVDVTGLRSVPHGGVELLTDTTVTLCGREGAAYIYGPQKGADEEMCRLLDDALKRFATNLQAVLPGQPDEAGAGAAGGTGFGLSAWGGKLVPGAARIADLTGLTEEFERADVVVTGEGRFDDSSLTGKLVGSVLQRCAHVGTRSVVVAGQLAIAPPDCGVSLTELAGSPDRAMVEPAYWARRAGSVAARLL